MWAQLGVAALSALGARSQAKAAAKGGQLDLARLRREAAANGFNPLTVLGATGGAGFYTPQGVPGFLSFMAQQAPGVLQGYQQAQATKIDSDLAKAQTGYYQAQTDLSRAEITRLGQRQTMPGAPTIQTAPTPKTFEEWGYIPAYTPSGMPIEVHGGVAARLGLEPGGIYIAEDDEAVLGDLGSVPSQIGGIGDNMFETIKGWVYGRDANSTYLRSGHSGAGGAAVAVPGQPVPAPPPITITPTPRPSRRTGRTQ